MRTVRRLTALLLPLALTACGGGGNPAAPPLPGEVHSLEVVVFYDENANGRLDSTELGRVPGVTVGVAGRSARSAILTGQATLSGLPGGQQSLAVRADSLPPFYVAPAPLAVEVPSSSVVPVPITLPIRGNVPNRYMAFGDSITVGDGSSDKQGYPPLLEDLLRQHFGAGQLVNEGVDGTRTDAGAARIGASLARQQPAFTLIHYGTNDWNKCANIEVCPPLTAENLRSMVQQVKNTGGLPVLATIIPVNVGYDERVPPQRNEYVAAQDRLIRDVATQENALLVDLESAFYKAGGNDLSQLFSDHVHPNDRGYEIMASEFFKALSTSAGGGASAAAWSEPALVLPADTSLGLRTPRQPGRAPEGGAARAPRKDLP